MKFWYPILYFVLLVCFSNKCFSQNQSEVDSLELALQKTVSDTDRIHILNSIGYLTERTEPNKSIKYSNMAIELSKEIGYPYGLGYGLNNRGVVYNYQGSYLTALEDHINALKIREEIGDSAGIAASIANIGLTYYFQKELWKAVDHIKRALSIYQRLNNKLQAENCYINLGGMYFHLDSLNLSLEYFNQALVIQKNRKEGFQMGLSYNNIGAIYVEKNNLVKAEEYFHLALDIFTMANDKTGLVLSLSNLGSTFSEKKMSTKAISYFETALSISREINSKTDIETAYLNLSNEYYKLYDYQKAYEYHQLYATMKDSIFNEESMKSMNEMQARYESEKQEEELDILDAQNKINDEEIENKKYQQYGLTGGIILVLAFLGLFANRFREKSKTNELLEETNHKLEEKKNSLEEKKTELQNLSLVANETFNSVVIADGKGKMEWANFSFSRLTGYTLDKFTEKFGENLIDNSSEENLSARIEEARKTRRSVKYESKLKRKNGEELWTQTTLSPILDEQDNIKNLIAIDTNITELKETLSKIQEKDKDITDSINYASRIQNSVKVSIEEIKKIFPNCFIINKQSDTVGGLTHYYFKSNHLHYLGIIDCKIEGVPGAFLAMLTTDLVNNIISTSENIEPKEIAVELKKEFAKIKRSNADEDLGFEKIDLKICCINPNEKKINFDGSSNGKETLPLIMSNCDLKLNGSTGNQSLEQMKETITEKIKAEKNVLVVGIEL